MEHPAADDSAKRYPRTPDGRYFVVRARLWRCTDPRLPEAERMGEADAAERIAAARRGVQAAKVALGERGPVWWSDGAPDEGGRHPRNSSYAAWYAGLSGAEP